jgi:H+/gluconate symporter-like permease
MYDLQETLILIGVTLGFIALLNLVKIIARFAARKWAQAYMQRFGRSEYTVHLDQSAIDSFASMAAMATYGLLGLALCASYALSVRRMLEEGLKLNMPFIYFIGTFAVVTFLGLFVTMAFHAYRKWRKSLTAFESTHLKLTRGPSR